MKATASLQSRFAREASIVALLLLAGSARGADEPEHIFFFYALGIGIDGHASAGSTNAEIDMDAAEVLDHLEFGAMGSYRWQSGPWSVQGDAMFASLAGDKTVAQDLLRTTIDLDQLMLEADGGYRFYKNLEHVFGARYWDFQTRIALRGLGPGGNVVTEESRKKFVDPVFGLRVVTPIGENWKFIARGDIGGFGVGSDFSWQATVFFDWAFARNFRFAFGYRVFDMRFDDLDGEERRALDLMESGPGLGVAYVF